MSIACRWPAYGVPGEASKTARGGGDASRRHRSPSARFPATDLLTLALLGHPAQITRESGTPQCNTAGFPGFPIRMTGSDRNHSKAYSTPRSEIFNPMLLILFIAWALLTNWSHYYHKGIHITKQEQRQNRWAKRCCIGPFLTSRPSGIQLMPPLMPKPVLSALSHHAHAFAAIMIQSLTAPCSRAWTAAYVVMRSSDPPSK
ncbi:hypothetical protein BT67DRAFT_116310 [Trichocladium antarcticum]|uniref:Uncharacterized protein n=1 Tax=Trichocladium antarcticum TaxID=1450529 RepID=A0AAN6US17_9PEZI|nr:hypothetical protein BT67DRAFT_116310 [Trichocladium antarcticum]